MNQKCEFRDKVGRKFWTINWFIETVNVTVK